MKQLARPFHHALTVSKHACRGCTRCMKNCPTEAIRIVQGTAHVHPEVCIDCGQCLDACPYRAITIEQDDFRQIFNYSYRAAVIPSVFIGQFPEEIPESFIFQSLYDIGFTHIYEAEFGVDILSAMSQRFSTYASHKPILSSFCPAVVRLIQIRYPSLVDHINLLRPPMEITALFIREKLRRESISMDALGIFYVTPCAAKIADIKTPEKGCEPLIDGVINLDYLYNLIYTNIMKHKKRLEQARPAIPRISARASLWSLTGGEQQTVSGNAIAVDEIHNVIEFLERLENDEVRDLDFLELLSCDEGCAGGVLNPSNRFLTVERLKHRAASLTELDIPTREEIRRLSKHFYRSIKVDAIEAHASDILDEDISAALDKMEKVQRICAKLPGIDCGVCGSPNCEALARDVVLGRASIDSCGILQLSKNRPAIKKIWGNKLSGEALDRE